MFNVIYNGVNPTTLGCWLATIPTITPSTDTRTRQTIVGMDGELLGDDEAYSDAQIDFTIHAKSDTLQAKLRDIRKWLSGTGILIISDHQDAYYEVKEVTYTTFLKKDEKYGRVAVSMKVYPYEFLNSGDTDITSYSTVNNPAMASKPLYKITGNGSGTLTVNGNTMTFTVNGTLYIDTRRKLAYDGSGNGKDGAINGFYEGLYLKAGANTISCSAGTLTLKPKWGYRI
jgi:Phage-related protein